MSYEDKLNYSALEVNMTEMVKTPRFLFTSSNSISTRYIPWSIRGVLVAKAVELDGIPSATRTVINPTAFYAALSMGLPDVMKLYPDRIPILHISAHGASGGIQLSSGDVINWLDLRQILMLINESLDGFLLLCMSACEGFSACQMAMQEGDGPHPYFYGW